jgi:O-antigen/teichoic acid export membrane protein
VTHTASYGRLLRGGGLVTLGNLVAAGLGLVLLLFLARTLSPADLALVVGVIVVIDGGQMFLDAMVNTGMITLASRHGRQGAPSPDLLRAGFWTKVFCGGAYALVMVVLARPMSVALVGDASMRVHVMLAGVAAALAGMHGFVLALLTAREAFGRIALVSFWKNMFRILAVAPFLLRGTPDAQGAALAICAVTGMTLLASTGMVSWAFLRTRGALWGHMRALLGVNGWMMLAAFAMLGGRLDVWLVGILGNPVQAGLYAVAAQLCVGVGVVTQAIVTTLLPTVSRFETSGQVRDFLVRSTRALLPLFALPLVAWGVAAPVITLVFGAVYAGSAGAFTVLLLAAIMTLVSAPLMLVLLSVGEARVMALGVLAQFGLRVALAVPLVPLWGAVGLAVADVASRLMAMAVIGWFIWRVLQREAAIVAVGP